MHNILSTAYRRKVEGANFNHHNEGELHPDRILDCHDIVFILEGGWEIGQDGENYLLGEGDVIFLHAGHHHYGVNGFLPGVKTMYLHIENAPKDRLEQTEEWTEQPEGSLCLPVVVHSHDCIAVKALFAEIIQTFWSDINHKAFKLAALADLFLVQLADLSNAKQTRRDNLVEDVLYQIRMTPNKIYTLTELAEARNVSSRNLTTRFRNSTGKTIHQYQLEHKLEMAYMLIQDDPGRPFKDIARNLGFYDEFHFSKLFRKKFGFPPSVLKKRHE